MAVTVADLGIALRLSADGMDLDAAQTSILTRLLGVGEAHVALLIPAAPEAIQNECVVRLATYLFDMPTGRRDSFSNGWVNSGAGSLASRWLTQSLSESTAAEPALNAGLIADLIDTALAPVLTRLRTLEEAGGVTVNEYTGRTGWAAAKPVTAADLAAGVTFEDGHIDIPDTTGPGYHWFGVPETLGYPDRILGDRGLGDTTGGYSRQPGTLTHAGVTYIVGVSNSELVERFEDFNLTLEYN